MTSREDNPSVQEPCGTPKLWGSHTWISLAITGVMLTVMATMLDLEDVWNKLTGAHWGFILLGSLAHYATYPVRGMRWRRCLVHLGITKGAGHFGLLVFFYNFIDNLVPAKLGDLYGAHLARINLGIRRSTALGSLVFVRMIDAWVVLGLAGISSYYMFSDALPEWVVGGLIFGIAISIVATGIVVAAFLLGNSTDSRMPAWLEKRLPKSILVRITSFRTGIWPRRENLFAIGIFTTLIWSLEIAWIWGLATGFGIALAPIEIVFLTMIPLLASTVPLTPSGAGFVESSLYACLRAVGVGGPAAAAFTVLNRLIDFWLHIVLGVIAWALRDRLNLRTWREVPMHSASRDALELETASPPRSKTSKMTSDTAC